MVRELSIKIIYFVGIILLTSCNNAEYPDLTKNEILVLDSLQKEFYCEISYSISKDYLRLKKPFNFEK